jgi:hypothetical protein
VFGERHLRHLLRSYATYYNAACTHLSVNKDAPRGEPYMPLVAFCLTHFLADFIICMCQFDFRQAQRANGNVDDPQLATAYMGAGGNFVATAPGIGRRFRTTSSPQSSGGSGPF